MHSQGTNNGRLTAFSETTLGLGDAAGDVVVTHVEQLCSGSVIMAVATEGEGTALLQPRVHVDDRGLQQQRLIPADGALSRISLIRGWARVVEGVICLLAVAIIWVGAGVLVQYLYASTDMAPLPFFLTYVCNSEFIMLLPLRWVRERYSFTLFGRTMPAAARTDWRAAAKAGLIVCPLWFLAQGSYNWALAGTSVSSSTILSTTSCVFTFGLSLIFLKERFRWQKLAGVVVTVGGAALVSFSDTSQDGVGTWWGDALSLFSAFMYGVYTTAIRRFVPDDGKVSVAVFFGFLGLFNSILLAPLVGLLHGLRVEVLTGIPAMYLGLVLIKGLFDNVLSDLLWARAIQLTSPTVATVALSLTIPFAMIADLVTHHTIPTAFVACGSVAVMCGFIVSTYSMDPQVDAPGPVDTSTTDAAEEETAPLHHHADSVSSVDDVRHTKTDTYASPALELTHLPHSTPLDDDRIPTPGFR